MAPKKEGMGKTDGMDGTGQRWGNLGILGIPELQ